MNFKGKGRRNKGITLIALVITIIVLLILAGVTINAITENGNVMEKAQQARTENNHADELDSIKLAVVDAVAKSNENDGKAHAKELGDSLNGLIDGDVSGSAPWTVKGKITGKKYTITENGNVTEESTSIGASVTAEELNALIGTTVEGYTTDSDSETSKWRLFYADETNEEVFLIFNDVVPINKAFEGGGVIPLNKKDGTEYSGSNDISEYGKNYNPMWFEKLKGQAEDKNNNAKATAYLCDPKNWEKYISKDAPDGTYAVGGPTKELFMKSWNEAVKNNLITDVVVSLEYADVTEKGYAYNRPYYFYEDVSAITPNKLEGLYNNGASYWIASPTNDDGDFVCFFYSSGDMNSVNCTYDFPYDSAYHFVRPLVSIPISNVKIGADGTIQIVP